MSIKLTGKFDFILATLKVSPICFMMFLELLAVMVCRITCSMFRGDSPTYIQAPNGGSGGHLDQPSHVRSLT